MGQSLGVSYQTVNSYLDYLDGAFLIRRLHSYQANIAKRLVKRPKLYWRDSGLLHALLNVADRDLLLAQPRVGASWEGFVIEQAIGQLNVSDRAFVPYYFQTSDQIELDLVLDFGAERWAIEIKLTSAPGTEDFRALDRAADLIGASRRFLISQTKNVVDDGKRASVGLERFLESLAESG